MNESVEFTGTDGMRLVGTLTRPETSGQAPAALLINGSGPLDRDSNMPGQALNITNAIASALAVHGVASLRYDKRGVGESGGDYLTTGFDQETADASAAVEELRRTSGIDGDRVAVRQGRERPDRRESEPRDSRAASRATRPRGSREPRRQSGA